MKNTTILDKVFPGFKYMDKVSGEILSVISVSDVIAFDNGLEVSSLDAFSPIDTEIKLEHLANYKIRLVNGELFVGDKKVETGTLKIKSIISKGAFVVSLEVEALFGVQSQLFTYYVLTDTFESSQIFFDSYRKIRVFDDVTFIKFTSQDTFMLPKEGNYPDGLISVDDEDDSQIVTKVVKDQIILFHEGELVSILDKTDAYDFVFVEETKDSYILIGEQTKESRSFQIDQLDVYGSFKKRTTIDEFVFHPYSEDEEDDSLDFENYKKYSTNLREGDEFVSVKITNCDDNSLLIRSKEGFVYSNNGHHPRFALGKTALNTLDAYPYFVGIESGVRRNVFKLSNDKREVVELEVVKTQDRGYVTTVL